MNKKQKKKLILLIAFVLVAVLYVNALKEQGSTPGDAVQPLQPSGEIVLVEDDGPDPAAQ